MATAPTLIGPVGTRQINRNFYVGMADLTTIQKAVTVAVAIGSGCVIIPAGYAGSDTIASLIGGSANVYISDQRTAQAQNYVWSGSAYTPADFVQAQGYVTKGMPTVPQGSAALSYNPAGTTGIGTATLYIAAMPGMGIPSFNLTGMSSNGTGNQTYLRAEISPAGAVPVAGIPQIEMPSQLGLFNDGFNHYNLWAGMAYLPGGKGMTIWAKPTENAIDLQGSTIGGAYDQTIRLNYLGGNVQIGPSTFSPIGDITGVGDIAAASIAADDADFDTCEVGNSPVRTFANTPDGPGQGMVWPTDGIPVSLGDHWQNPSIDPASLATWPPAGIAVSTGTAWGTSVDTANVAMRNLANIFTQPNSFSFNANGSTTVTVQGGLQIAWNVGNGSGETDFINIHSAVGGGFYWYNVAPGATLTSATPKAMFLDSANILHTFGDIITTNSLRSTGTSITTATPNSVWMDFTSGWGRIVTVGPSAGTLAGLSINGIDGASAGFKQFATFGTDASGNASVTSGRFIATVSAEINGPMTCGQSSSLNNLQSPPSGLKIGGNLQGFNEVALVSSAGQFGGFNFYIAAPGVVLTSTTSPVCSITSTTNLLLGNFLRFGPRAPVTNWQNGTSSINSDGLSLVINAGHGAGQVFFNYDQGTGGVTFCNGSGVSVANIDAAGNINSGNNIVIGQNGPRYSWDGGSSFIDGAPGGRLLINSHTGAGSLVAITGALTVSGNKAFLIPHPLDDSKDLLHACLEGPENGVYYRGEGATVGGWAEITLPDYFEALVKPDERSVLLTPLFEEDDEPIGALAASQVKDGKFRVWSASPTQKFYWVVIAVRGDIPPLEVEPTREKHNLVREGERDHADANGNGTTEDGEPDTSDSRDATATTTGTARTRRVH
jgi:hypothetical protein